jgi:hypothetical protein
MEFCIRLHWTTEQAFRTNRWRLYHCTDPSSQRAQET